MAVVNWEQRCKGCNYCLGVCPKGAISLAGLLNKQGYAYVTIDEGLCIECGMCYTMCPESVFEILTKEE